MFSEKFWAKVWKIERHEDYTVIDVSVSIKNKETGKYDTTFHDKYMRCYRAAHEKLKTLEDGVRIRPISFGIKNRYDKEKNVMYQNNLLFDFEVDPNFTTAPADDGGDDGLEDDPF